MSAVEGLFETLGEATDIDDAVAKLGAMEPNFEALAAEMKASGEPSDAAAAKFNAAAEERMGGQMAQIQGTMMKLMGVDPTNPATADPIAMQEKGAKIQAAMEKLTGHFEGAWPNVGPDQ